MMNRPDDKVLFGFKRWVFFVRESVKKEEQEKEDKNKKN